MRLCCNISKSIQYSVPHQLGLVTHSVKHTNFFLGVNILS